MIAIALTNKSFATDAPIATDSRIKTFIYNQNEIFRLVLHYNYQTSIEFEEGEEIKTISCGNNYAWQLTPVDNRIFIKPLEDNILTNMTIISNKRVYQFEIQSKPHSDYVDSELVYVVRFFLPATEEDAPIIKNVDNKKEGVLTIQPYNFNYTVVGSVKFSPNKVFDDGVKTYLYYNKDIRLKKPDIKVVQGKKTIKITPRIVGDYLVIDHIGERLELNFNKNILEIINKSYLATDSK
jgi:type IV secretion system protein VirB9